MAAQAQAGQPAGQDERARGGHSPHRRHAAPLDRRLPGALKASAPARVALTTATMQVSRVILDCNGVEELTPPGQAILVRRAVGIQ